MILYDLPPKLPMDQIQRIGRNREGIKIICPMLPTNTSGKKNYCKEESCFIYR